MGKNVTLANRLKRLEQRLPPPPPDPVVTLLAMVFTKTELRSLLDHALAKERGELVEDTGEIRDIRRRGAARFKEMENEPGFEKLLIELDVSSSLRS